jgi:NADPH-dependent 7-cyano-7-deazaguanine reductase QueF
VSVLTVPESGAVDVTAAGLLIHLCPHRDEEDLGRVTVTWRCSGSTFELHALAEYLSNWEQTSLSHEELTDRIAYDLSNLPGVELLSVATTWQTAGLEVSCSTSPTPADPKL